MQNEAGTCLGTERGWNGANGTKNFGTYEPLQALVCLAAIFDETAAFTQGEFTPIVFCLQVPRI